jgi:hypothetical protein
MLCAADVFLRSTHNQTKRRQGWRLNWLASIQRKAGVLITRAMRTRAADSLPKETHADLSAMTILIDKYRSKAPLGLAAPPTAETLTKVGQAQW